MNNTKEHQDTYNYSVVISKSMPIGIKKVVLQGSSTRVLSFATRYASLIGDDLEGLGNDQAQIFDLNQLNEVKNNWVLKQISLYLVNNVLCVSHGMGCASIFAVLNALNNLLVESGNYNFEFIRLGTSGGIGIEAGNVVVTHKAYMADLTTNYKSKISDKYKSSVKGKYSTLMDVELQKLIIDAQPTNLNFGILSANTIAADDFYLSQVRSDGAISPTYTEDDIVEYFKQCQRLNIVNFEMESTALAIFCNYHEIPCAMVASVLVNRLNGDQIKSGRDELIQYMENGRDVLLNYLTNSGR